MRPLRLIGFLPLTSWSLEFTHISITASLGYRIMRTVQKHFQETADNRQVLQSWKEKFKRSLSFLFPVLINCLRQINALINRANKVNYSSDLIPHITISSVHAQNLSYHYFSTNININTISSSIKNYTLSICTCTTAIIHGKINSLFPAILTN